MARIRTIKPEFFKHDVLFDLEKSTKLPIRLAFAGLWTVCDREGRFEWRPRMLKTDVLPHDDIDFSRVLDALATRGFVVKYSVDGKEYGYVPGFNRHQVVNNRESASVLPPPEESTTPTRVPRVLDALPTPLVQEQGEGKGREGKGREEGSRVADADADESELTETGISPKLFSSYMQVRRTLKKQFIDNDSRERWVKKWRRFYAEGKDTASMLELMIENHWQGPVDERWVNRKAVYRVMTDEEAAAQWNKDFGLVNHA